MCLCLTAVFERFRLPFSKGAEPTSWLWSCPVLSSQSSSGPSRPKSPLSPGTQSAQRDLTGIVLRTTAWPRVESATSRAAMVRAVVAGLMNWTWSKELLLFFAGGWSIEINEVRWLKEAPCLHMELYDAEFRSWKSADLVGGSKAKPSHWQLTGKAQRSSYWVG